jgi:hypothetical protein
MGGETMGIKETISDFATGAASGAYTTLKEDGLAVKVELDISPEDKLLAAGILQGLGSQVQEGIEHLKEAADKIDMRWKYTQFLFSLAVVAQVGSLFV